jgi:8-oxo-dGTP diphosphatase
MRLRSPLPGLWSHRLCLGTDWTYTTILACTQALLPVTATAEGHARWVGQSDVPHLRLHPGLAASWPQLREILHTISVH